MNTSISQMNLVHDLQQLPKVLNLIKTKLICNLFISFQCGTFCCSNELPKCFPRNILKVKRAFFLFCNSVRLNSVEFLAIEQLKKYRREKVEGSMSFLAFSSIFTAVWECCIKQNCIYINDKHAACRANHL